MKLKIDLLKDSHIETYTNNYVINFIFQDNYFYFNFEDDKHTRFNIKEIVRMEVFE